MSYNDYLGNDDLDDLLQGDDELGADYEIVGEDYEIVGARARRKRGGGAVPALLEQIVPFPATSVATLASADITANPQRAFRTERLLVPSAIAASFIITDLVIGRDSMMVSTGSMPAQIFSEVGVGVRLRGYTANLGNDIVISVTSIDSGTVTFRGGIIGSSVA